MARPAANPDRKPHLIFLVADQLRQDALGAYTGPKGIAGQTNLTPNLDRLAQRCAIFSRHFTPCPLCIPARCSLFTGLHTHQHGAIINGWFPHERKYAVVRDNVPLLHDHLVRAGYRVVHVGILHVRTNPDLALRLPQVEFINPHGPGEHHKQLEARGLMLGDLQAFRDPVIDYDQGKPVVFHATSTRTGVFPLREDLFFDAVLAEKMAQTIEKHKGDKPLALFGMFWLPHPPLWAPAKWANLIDPDTIELPASVGRWYRSQPAMQLANIPGQLGAHVSEPQWRQTWAVYLGMVAMLDQCVGRVLAALENAQMFDDSLVIFSADHGEMLGSHGLFQKMCLYEEAIRVPLLMKLPGQTNSRRIHDLTDHLDLTATLTDLAAATPMPHSPGRSLRHIADSTDTSRDVRHLVFAAYDGNAGRGFAHRMARSRTHKFIHNINDEPEL
ncbi:MAG: sulfatase-like hydrolase/transferase, partial [Phycisphaeraceae bacterium]